MTGTATHVYTVYLQLVYATALAITTDDACEVEVARAVADAIAKEVVLRNAS